MQARMSNPVFVIPGVLDAMRALAASTEKSSLPAATRQLVELRASQINGCSVCVDIHTQMMKKAGETDERLHLVAAWRHAPCFTAAERASLALGEALTRIADREDPVSDAIWAEAARHYDEPALGALLVTIAGINVWNRLNLAVGQLAGEWKP
jgi:AhpD family alkylhydroperoxidase